MKLNLLKLQILSLATAACIVNPTLSAQDDESYLSENEANIYDLATLEIVDEQEPGNLNLDSLQIQRLNPLDMAAMLANESNIAVGGGSAVAQKIYVRGFEDTMLNVTVDGAQQIGELYHHQARVQIEPEFIQTFTLDAGAGAATNGAGALTGLLKVTLKDAFDMLDADQSFGSFMKLSGDTSGDGSYKAVGSGYGKLTDNIGLIATFTYGDGGDYDDGNGDLIHPTAYTHERGYIKLNGNADLQTWSLAYENLHDFGTYYERPHMGNFRGSFILSDHEMDRETLTLNHNYNKGDDLVDLESTLYWTDSSYMNHRNTTGALYGEGNVESVGLDIRNNMNVANQKITFGFDYRQDSSSSSQQATPPPWWGFSDQEVDVLGLYVQNDFKLIDDLTLSLGLRYDSYDHEVNAGVGAGANTDSTGLSPNIQFRWAATENLMLRATYSTAHRGVAIREAFFSAIYAHDGTLEAEEADNFELGFGWEKDGFFVNGTVYQQNIENYINSEWIGAEVWGYWRNMGDAKTEGYEIETGKNFENMSVSFGVWNADPEFNNVALTDSDLGLGTSIGRTWTAKFNYYDTTNNLDYYFVTRLVEDEPNFISDTAPDKDGYITSDIIVNWRPYGNDKLVISGGITNMFDEFYYDHATFGYESGSGEYAGFPAKGRSFFASAAVKF